MGMTFNRRPFSVNTPNKDDVSYKYHNHFNWKGISKNKNFLTVDQETFEDCENVYMDSEGLLRSRPSLKPYYPFDDSYSINQEDLENSPIYKTWQFGNITVLQRATRGGRFTIKDLYLNKNRVLYTTVRDDGLFIYKDNILKITLNAENPKLVFTDGKLFIATNDLLQYYDVEKEELFTTPTSIYTPVTKIIYNGIDEASAEAESPNLMTGNEIYRYIYDNIFTADFNEFRGQELTISINNTNYNITFVNRNELVFVDKMTSLEQSNFSNDIILGRNGDNIPLIEIAENGVMLVTDYIFNTKNKKVDTWNVHWTVDGKIFNRVSVPDDIIAPPKITKNGLYVVIFKENGPYILSILESKEEGYKYSSWTNLCKIQSNASSTYDNWKLNMNKVNYSDSSLLNYNCTTAVTGDFYSDDNFAFTYGAGYTYIETENSRPYPDVSYEYDNFYCVVCENNVLRREVIFESKISTDVQTKTGINDVYGGKSVRIYNLDDITFYYSLEQGLVSTNYISGKNTGTFKLTNLKLIEDKNPVSGQTWNNILKGNYELSLRDENESGVVNESENNFEIYIRNYVTHENSKKTTSVCLNSLRGLKLDLEYIAVSIRKITINPPSINLNNGNIYTASYGSTYLRTESNPSMQEYNYLGETFSIMPNVKVNLRNNKLIVALRFTCGLKGITYNNDNNTFYRNVFEGYYEIKNTGTSYNVSCIKHYITPYLKYKFSYSEGISNKVNYTIRSCLRDAISISSGRALFGRVDLDSGNLYYRIVKPGDVIELLREEIDDSNIYYNTILKFSRDYNYLVTNKYLFPYNEYSEKTYTPVPLLFEAIPVDMYYFGNTVDGLYLATDKYLYSNSINTKVKFDILHRGTYNFNEINPDYISQLKDYYFAKDKTLYISSPKYDKDGNFLWYFPDNYKQTFDYNITGLHPISDNEMAIFFENEIYYNTYDENTKAYRYYKSKIQVGCKAGSDIITSFDGKYVLFPSNIGLVAMSYQQFVATTEQSLTYLSDSIYDIFYNYMNKTNLPIKLHKFAHWIFVYKTDDVKGFILDLRNNSWWPISLSYNISKLLTLNNELIILCKERFYNLNKKENCYYDDYNIVEIKTKYTRDEIAMYRYIDFDNSNYKNNINWYLLSQKLYLNAINYYKHISNITLISNHNIDDLENTKYNVNELGYKLLINNYRNKIDKNIENNKPSEFINFKVDTIKTFIQRLNFSKVNEFQFKLTNNDSSINIPLSLSSITIKYKIGGQIR